MRRRQMRGFTLAEMIAVLAISLSLTLMIVPIFRLSTSTVQNVEEKLAAYEAARNILDVLEQEIKQAMVNERGEHFSIKHVPYKDTDMFTRDQTGNPLAMDTTPYIYSRREGCALNLVRPQPGAQFSNASWDRSTLVEGTLAHPLAYNTQMIYEPTLHESWFESIRTTEMYPQPQNDSGQNVVYGEAALTRTQLLNDVSQIELSMYLQARDNEPDIDAGGMEWHNEPPYRLAPGNELTTERKFMDWIDQYTRMHLGGMNVLDFNVAYWNDVDGKFYDAEDNTVIYFAPPPKAVRLTITVCDRLKRKEVTMSRIVQIPVAMGDGVVLNKGAAADTNYATPAPFNRQKDLTTLEPGVVTGP
jgi:prepilin-type N-terminal cleavage/methylation domain-containing protein